MNKELEQKIWDMKEEILSGVLQSVSIESVRSEELEGAPFGKGPKAALLDAIMQSEKLGIPAVNVDDKIGYSEIGEGSEMVAVLGHLDVVPLGEGWTKNPLGERTQDKLYGRGVADNKGPIISSLYALKAIQDLGIKLDRRIRVIYGTDEETGFGCVYHYIDSGQELPVAGFTPDAEYPAIFAEKGMLGFTFSKKIAPSDDFELIDLQGGVAKNVVTPQVSMKYKSKQPIFAGAKEQDGIYQVSFEGKSAHASTPEKGENAFMLLCRELAKSDIQNDLTHLAKFVDEKFNMEPNGQSMGVFYEDAESGKITLSIGLVEYKDNQLSFTLDIRYPVTMNDEDCIQKLKKVAQENGLNIEMTGQAKPHYVPKDSTLIQTLMNVYREKTGDHSDPLAIGGGTYAKAFKNMVAFGIEFPGRPLLIHQPDEAIDIDDLIKSTQITAEAILRLANSKDGF